MRNSNDSNAAGSNGIMAQLLEKYVHGEISEMPWDRFMKLIDSEELGDNDRNALAAFFHDALNDAEGDDVYFPLFVDRDPFSDSSFGTAA